MVLELVVVLLLDSVMGLTMGSRSWCRLAVIPGEHGVFKVLLKWHKQHTVQVLLPVELQEAPGVYAISLAHRRCL